MAPCTSMATSASTCPRKVSQARSCGTAPPAALRQSCGTGMGVMECAWGWCSSGVGVGCSGSQHGAGGAVTAQLDARLQAPSWPETCRHALVPRAPALPLMWRRRRRVRQRAEGEPPALHSPCAAPAHGIPVTLPSLCPQGAQELSTEAAQEEGLAQAHGRKAQAPLPGALGRAATWPWWEGGRDPWASSCHLPPGPQQGVLHLEV